MLQYALLALGLSLAKPSDAARIRVRGESTFAVARVSPSDDGLQVTGSLRDESDQAISGATIVLEGVNALPCQSQSDVTDSAGVFCFLVTDPPPAPVTPSKITVSFAGNDYFAPSERQLELVATDLVLNLKLEVDAERWRLDHTSHRVTVRLQDADALQDRFQVRLWLEREARERVPLGAAGITPSRAAHFTVRSEDLGEPGPAQLSATIEHGNKTIARTHVPLVLVGGVQLAWAKELREARPSSGFEVLVAVSSQYGAVDSGWVETHVAGTVVGIVRVEAGVARVASRFLAPRRDSITLSARYISEQPWYVAGNTLSTELTLLPPSPWQHLPWLVLALGVTVWVLKTWRRPPSRKDRVAEATRDVVRPGIRVLESGPNASGWQGTVRDAHTAEPIADATLTISIPSVDAAGAVGARASTGADGRFDLPHLDSLPEGARLVVSSPSHSTLEQAVPAPGSLDIGLVTRRRSLLRHLTRWAESMGTPWERGPQTTPARVAGIAASRGDASAQRWALEVEEAAFGPTEPDEQRERGLIGMTPPLDRPNVPKRD